MIAALVMLLQQYHHGNQNGHIGPIYQAVISTRSSHPLLLKLLIFFFLFSELGIEPRALRLPALLLTVAMGLSLLCDYSPTPYPETRFLCLALTTLELAL